MSRIESLVDATLKPIRESIASGETEFFNPLFKKYHDGTLSGPAVRLRVDWELSKDAVENLDIDNPDKRNPVVAKLMLNSAKDDLIDLVTNGDVSNYEEALLKAIDGSKKRGKEPIDVQIIAAETFSEFKPGKKSWEYTMHIVLYTKWEK